MCNKIFTSITVLIYSILHISAQSAQIDTFQFTVSPFGDKDYLETLYYPVISTGKADVDNRINLDLKNRLTSNEFPDDPMDSTIIKWASDGIDYLNFTVTYNQNNIISLTIHAEGCGAYCTGWSSYFNYSLNTGKWLSIADIIDTTGAFRKTVYSQKDLQFTGARLQLDAWRTDPDWKLDDYTFETVMEYYDDCDASFYLNDYALFPEYLQIIKECWLPHVLQTLEPFIELKFPYDHLGSYLKVRLK